MSRNTLYDPIRKKDVPDTPEERVRQDTVRFLLDEIKVPEHLLTVEYIIVHDFRSGARLDQPWLLVECKAPGEYTWQSLQAQLNRYLGLVSPQYVMLALGDAIRFFALDRASGQFKKIDSLPEYGR